MYIIRNNHNHENIMENTHVNDLPCFVHDYAKKIYIYFVVFQTNAMIMSSDESKS